MIYHISELTVVPHGIASPANGSSGPLLRGQISNARRTAIGRGVYEPTGTGIIDAHANTHTHNRTHARGSRFRRTVFECRSPPMLATGAHCSTLVVSEAPITAAAAATDRSRSHRCVHHNGDNDDLPASWTGGRVGFALMSHVHNVCAKNAAFCRSRRAGPAFISFHSVVHTICHLHTNSCTHKHTHNDSMRSSTGLVWL